jgi:hypothetical protein
MSADKPVTTKELYQAQVLIQHNQRASRGQYMEVDHAIQQYIDAEINVRQKLSNAAGRIDRVEPTSLLAYDGWSRMNEIYRERFKTVICKDAVKNASAVTVIQDDWSEEKTLQTLADYRGCPNAIKNWQ